MNIGLFRIKLVLNLSLFNTLYVSLSIKYVKQGKIQYHFTDAKQIDMHSRFLHLRLS